MKQRSKIFLQSEQANIVFITSKTFQLMHTDASTRVNICPCSQHSNTTYPRERSMHMQCSEHLLRNPFSNTYRQAFTVFVDLPTYLCQQLKCHKWKQQHVFTDLPVTHYVLTCQSTPYERSKEAASVKTYGHANTHIQRIYTLAQSRGKYTSASITSTPLNWAVAPSEALSAERNLSTEKVPHW